MQRATAEALLTSFCADLRRLWTEAGGPSLRVLERRLRLGKSQLGAILSGRIRRPPDWQVVAGLVKLIGDYTTDRDRLSVPTGITGYWRPRFAVLEHAYSQSAARRAAVTAAEWAWVPPRQLPHALPAFAGRVDELTRLDSFLPAGGSAVIVVLSGTAGVGKTALAVRWSHRALPHFPDGQLYVDLRGFDPSGAAAEPAQALREFLEALGVPADRIPVSPAAQGGLYRSVLAGRRVLIVADNARHEHQVRPLLPGAAGSLVVVTSRARLSGLVAIEGARSVAVGLPSPVEARQLLAARLGRERIDAEPSAVAEIVEASGRLPLALAVVAARAESQPARSLTDIAAQLRSATSTLDLFGGGDPATDMRAVFSWSYQVLSEPAGRLFRLLGRCPGPDISPAAAASAAGLPETEVRALLAELTRANLLTETSDGRVGYHELHRAYAMELADRHDSDEQRRAVRRRLLDHYLHTGYAAALLVNPVLSPLVLAEPADGVAPEGVPDRDAALGWFAAERAVLLSIMDRAPDGFDRHSWQLGQMLHQFLTATGRLHDNHRALRAALRAAQRIDDRVGQAYTHRSLGHVQSALEQFADARRHSQAALDLFDTLGDRVSMARSHLILGCVAIGLGAPREAARHAEHAHRLSVSAGDRCGRAFAANNLACAYIVLGRRSAAMAYFREAMAIFEELDDVSSVGNVWASLGGLYFTAGRPQAGNGCYQRALGVFRELSDRVGEANTYTVLGDSHQRAGDHAAARRAWQRAVTILDDLGHDGVAKPLHRLSAAGRG